MVSWPFEIYTCRIDNWQLHLFYICLFLFKLSGTLQSSYILLLLQLTCIQILFLGVRNQILFDPFLMDHLMLSWRSVLNFLLKGTCHMWNWVNQNMWRWEKISFLYCLFYGLKKFNRIMLISVSINQLCLSANKN